VSQGWKTTWEQLVRSQNDSVDDLLLRLLDTNDPAVWRGATETLLLRRSQAGLCELLRRWQSLDTKTKQLVRHGSSRFMKALRDAVVSNDNLMVENACQAACYLREYDLIPILVNVAEDGASVNGDLAAKAVLVLSRLLYEESAGPRDYTNRCDPQLIRGRLVRSLEKSVNRFRKHCRPDLVAAFLCLAKRDNATLAGLLGDPHDPAYQCLVDQLTNSSQLSVIRLLLDFLDTPRLPSSVLCILSRRTDVTFIGRLLNKLQRPLSKTIRTNLKRMENIHWALDQSLLAELEEQQQAAAMRLVSASGMKRSKAFSVVSFLLEHGKPRGRAAAAEVLADFNGSDADRLALSAMSDTYPEVQALAIRQMRRRGIPGALARLLDFVESSHEQVREAVRASLPEFHFDRYLASFDVLDDAVRQSTAKLVFKVNPELRGELVRELDAPVRSRRLRGLQIVQTMQIVEHLEDRVLKLLADNDHMVRAEAARALQSSDTSRAVTALRRALLDRSVAVQEAARISLQKVGQKADSALAPQEQVV